MKMKNNELIDTALAALLHDIGKFSQRKNKFDSNENKVIKEKYGKFLRQGGYIHSAYTAIYLEDMDLVDLMDASAGHHVKNLSEVNMKMKDYVISGDRISSAIDRKDEENESHISKGSSEFVQRRIYPLFKKISIYNTSEKNQNDKNWRLDLNTLTKTETPINRSNFNLDKANAFNQYKNLWDDFYEKSLDIRDTSSNRRELFHKIYPLLKEYTTTIPSSTYKIEEPTVSLFDHLKLTSAIACSMHLSPEGEKNKFILLEYDISGIQKFIYKITEGQDSKKGVAKALRGRSFYIELLNNFIAYAILNAFDLTYVNVLYSSGGGGLILLPTGEENLKKLKEIINDLQNTLYKKHKGNITFVSATVEANKDELENFYSEKVWELKKKIGIVKNKKFINQVSNLSFFINDDILENTCRNCELNEASGEVCDECTSYEKLSNKLSKHTLDIIKYNFSKINNKDTLFSFENIGSIDFVSAESITEYDNVYFDDINGITLGESRTVANLVPIEDDRMLSFEEIATKASGDEKLAVLKMDVDNLGVIFSKGLDKEDNKTTKSFSKILTLSRFMDMFFTKNLKRICEKVALNTFYINYAGGDDLVIIGPADKIVDLTKVINDEFTKFTCNNDEITLSCGIEIFHPKKSIRLAVEKAEEALISSKNISGKNGITVLGKTFKFKDYEVVLELKNEFIKMLKDEIPISRGFIYNLMLVSDLALDNEEIKLYEKNIPKLAYNLARRTSNDKYIKKIKEYFIVTNMNLEKLKKHNIAIKLALLETRKNGGDLYEQLAGK